MPPAAPVPPVAPRDPRLRREGEHPPEASALVPERLVDLVVEEYDPAGRDDARGLLDRAEVVGDVVQDRVRADHVARAVAELRQVGPVEAQRLEPARRAEPALDARQELGADVGGHDPGAELEQMAGEVAAPAAEVEDARRPRIGPQVREGELELLAQATLLDGVEDLGMAAFVAAVRAPVPADRELDERGGAGSRACVQRLGGHARALAAPCSIST